MPEPMMPGMQPDMMGQPPMQPQVQPPEMEVPEGDIAMYEEPTADEVRQEEEEYEESVQYDLSPEEKAKIAEHIVTIVDECQADRSPWMDIRKDSLDMLDGIRPPKSDPWPNCSNITTMLTATHCKIMHAKLLPAVWNENTIHWRPIEKGDVINVDKVKKFMGWVVRQDIKLQPIIDNIVWDLIVNGTVALKTRWVTDYRTVSEKDDAGEIEYIEKAHRHCEVDNVSIDEVYLPKLWQGVDKSEFIAQDIYMRLPEIIDLADRKLYQTEDIEAKLTPQLSELVPESLRKTKEEIEGTADNAIQGHMESLPVRLIECYLKWQIGGKMKESVFTIAYESKAYLSGKPLSAVSPIGKRPWTIGQFVRRTGRPYGKSLPEEMRGLAKEADALHNQRVDAGTIAISPFGFYRAASSFKPEAVEIGPGVMTPVDDIKDVNIIQLQHNPVASFQEEGLITSYIEKLTATSAYQMGRESDVAKSRATATGTMAIIGQGEQAFTVLGIRTQGIIAELLTQVLQQYQMWMPEGYASRVLGEDGGDLFPDGVSQSDIFGQYDAYMTLDATAVNKSAERQASAVLVQMGQQLMLLAQDPRGYEIAKRFVESVGVVDYETILGPKPKANPKQTQGMLPMGPGQGGMGSDANPMAGGAPNNAGQPIQ